MKLWLTKQALSLQNLYLSSLRKFKLLPFLFILTLAAAQCQSPAESLPASPSPSPTPKPLLFPPVQPGDGTDLLDRLLEKGVIRVGIRVWPEAEFSPPAFRGLLNAAVGGALNGLEVDLGHHLADGLGLELEFIEAYPPVIASGDWRGEWDIALASLAPFDPAPDSPPGQQLFFSEPYAYAPTGILVPNTAGIDSPNQLAGRRLAYLEDSTYQRLLSPPETAPTIAGQAVLLDLPPGVEPVKVSNLQKAIRDLGRSDAADLDAVIGPVPMFRQVIVETDLPLKLITDPDALPSLPLAVAAVPQDGLRVERLIHEINVILARLRRQGALPELHLRWYNEDFSQPPPQSAN